jgi:parallel beta-helix repeat protein
VIEGWCITPAAAVRDMTVDESDSYLWFGTGTIGIDIAETTSHVVIRDNVMVGHWEGVALTHVSHVSIIDNTIADTFWSSIYTWRGDHVSISRNSLVRTFGGFRLEGATDNLITDQNIELDHGNPIQLLDACDSSLCWRSERNTFSGGTWSSPDDVFMSLLAKDTMVSGVTMRSVGTVAHVSQDTRTTFDGNHFVGGAPALLTGSSDSLTLTDNTVEGGTGDGFALWYPRTATITGNVIERMGGTGIILRAGSDVTVANNEVRDSFGGVLVDKTTRGDVTSNDIAGNTANGIAASASTDVQTARNRVSGNGGAGISYSGTSGGSLARNLVVDNGGPGVVVSRATAAAVLENAIAHNGGGVVAKNVFGALDVHGNNITSNGTGMSVTSSDLVDARNNWWGCSSGPTDPACDPVSGVATFDPWLPAENAGAGV